MTATIHWVFCSDFHQKDSARQNKAAWNTYVRYVRPGFLFLKEIAMSICDTTCCMTGQEQRLADGRGQSSPRARTNKALEIIRSGRPKLDIERAVLFTESMKQTEQYPLVLRWGKAIRYVMEHIGVVIQEGELLVGTVGGPGRISPLYPELRCGWFPKGMPATQKKDAYAVRTEDMEVFMEKVVPYWKGKTAHEHYLTLLPKETRDIIYGDDDYGATGLMQDNSNINSTLNWSGVFDKIIYKGVLALKAEAEQRLAELQNDLVHNHYDKIPFLQAVIECYEGMLIYARRYAEKARELAAEEKDPVRKKELETIASNCEHVPAYPARNFWEAMQAHWFAQVAYRVEQQISGGVALHRFDQYMNPIYVKDLKEGNLTEDFALELLEAMWLKIAQVVPFSATNAGNYWEGYAHFENCTIGGVDKYGRDATNEMTYLIIRSKKEFPLHYPEVSLRVHSGTPHELLHAAAELVKEGCGFPKFFNDEAIITQLLVNGASIDQARDYSAAGCTEIRMPNIDTYLPLGGNINLAAALEMALNDGKAHFGPKYEKLMTPSIARKDIKSYEDIVSNLRECLDFYVRHFMKRMSALELTNKQCLAAPFMSSQSDVCMKNLMDIHQCLIPGGNHHDTGNVNINGFGTCAESLCAIKKLVFDDKVLSLDELLNAVNNDFEGQEPLRQLVLNAPKYGNNDPYADTIARNLDAMIMTLVHGYESVFGEKYVKYVPVTSHVGLGNKTWATPNGRHAHTFLSEGISPTQGADINGPLCTMMSIANSMSRVYPNSCARLLNLKLNPQVVSGEKGTTDLMNLIRNFVDLKLWHVQIGIYNKEVLLKAREHPEDYKNLIVRVAGYSAYFVELSPSMQGEIIARTEHEMV